MKYILGLLLFSLQFAQAQKLKKADKALLTSLDQHIQYLADDKLEGRRTGSSGEKLAYEYISKQFETAGLVPKGENNTYLQAFEVNDGKEIQAASHFIINGQDLQLTKEYFPFAFSPNMSLETTASMALQESGAPWFYDVKDLLDANSNNPHYDLTDGIKTLAENVAKKGANALILFNSSVTDDELKFDPKTKTTLLAIPVLYIEKEAKEKYLKDETANLDIKIKVSVAEKKREGHNVIGYIDNGAAATIIIGAHYDHLGYGEDHNSLYTGSTPSIHNGADDNASGTSAVIELGKLLKGAKFKSNNYVLIAFSGEELGLFGSKYFTEHPTVDLAKVNYMINMDMVGRLKDSTHGLSIGGYGTSPAWAELVPKKDKYFTISFDSSGTGPSDHTSFYRKDIPVLFFFTGTHSDYHKPSDDADKINLNGALQLVKYVYALVERSDKKGKLPFLKTREVQMAKNSFKVTMGIMPDYTFTDPGVRVDGVSEGRPAQKAGVKAGDIITQLGDNKIGNIQDYMGALNKFSKGDATKLMLKRGIESLILNLVF